MKIIWIVVRVVGLCLSLLFFFSYIRGEERISLEVKEAITEREQARKNLEQAAPSLAKKYEQANKKYEEVLAQYSSNDYRLNLIVLPMALLSTSLLWEFVIIPLRRLLKLRRCHSFQRT